MGEVGYLIPGTQKFANSRNKIGLLQLIKVGIKYVGN